MDKIANSSGERPIFRTKWTKSAIHPGKGRFFRTKWAKSMIRPGKGRYLQHSNGCLNKREIVNLYQ